MFNGYRLKINGRVFPNSYIAKGTYSAVRGKRIVDQWTDGNLIEYQMTAPTKKTTIQFQLREHNSSEHTSIISFFPEDDDEYLTVEYYNDRTDSYLTGTFRLGNITFQDKNVIGNSIIYNNALVILTEH